jgi:hypothetical protein
MQPVEESMRQRRSNRSTDRERFSSEAIEERVERAHTLRGGTQQAERLLSEAEQVISERDEGEQQGGTLRQRRARDRARGKVVERALRVLERDDDAIRQVLARRERLDAVLDGSQPGELDEVVWFMVHELKLTKALSALAPPETYIDEETGEEIERRTMYPPLVLNLLGIMSRLLGVGSGPEIQAKLLTDERWMALLGFTSQEVLVGSTRRSEDRIGMTRDGQGGRFEEAGELGPARARPEGPRGALSSQTMAGHESALEPEKVVAFFNAVVRALARQGLFPQEVRASLDSTNEEVPPTFEGAGRVRRKAKVASKARRPKQMEVTVLGFKVWYLMCVVTGLPIAFAFDRIEKSEQEHAKELIDQGRANLDGYARLVSVALDRGFLDGDLFWWLKEDRGIEWYCPSKEKMEVTAEARQRVDEALAAAAKKGETALETALRLVRGRGKVESLERFGVEFCEHSLGPGRESLVVAGVSDLTATDFYGPGGTDSSRLSSKKFVPTPLHATVVLRWPDRSPQDQQDAKEHDEESKGPVVLLSPSAKPAFVRYALYDERSLIENRLNREGKQNFALGTSLARTEAAMRSATVFSTVALMLYRALDLHEERALEHLDRRAETLGVLRYRRQMMVKNRGTVIVVVGERYARLRLEELLTIAGFDMGRRPLG